MKEIIRQITEKEIIRYGFWGVCTVVFSMISYSLFLRLQLDYKVANILSIVLTKTFAYLTNKFFVFKSKTKNMVECIKEIAMFIFTRGLSGIVEFLGLIILVNYLGTDEVIGKFLLIILTTILNYVFGKTAVFKR